MAFEEALQAQRTEIAEYLAPITALEDDKIYSEIPEKQFWQDEEPKNGPLEESKSERSFVSEEAMRDDEEEEVVEQLTPEQV